MAQIIRLLVSAADHSVVDLHGAVHRSLAG
jgi:hypothetical protein